VGPREKKVPLHTSASRSCAFLPRGLGRTRSMDFGVSLAGGGASPATAAGLWICCDHARSMLAGSNRSADACAGGGAQVIGIVAGMMVSYRYSGCCGIRFIPSPSCRSPSSIGWSGFSGNTAALRVAVGVMCRSTGLADQIAANCILRTGGSGARRDRPGLFSRLAHDRAADGRRLVAAFRVWVSQDGGRRG